MLKWHQNNDLESRWKDLCKPLSWALIFSSVQQLILLHAVDGLFASQVSFPPCSLVTVMSKYNSSHV